MSVRILTVVLLGVIAAVLGYFTISSAGQVFRSPWPTPYAWDGQQAKYRLLLITQELETPFWDKVAAGALAQARQEGAGLQVWGSYNKNEDDFLKKLEIAIASKVDGIIVQGLDSDAFKELTKIRAGSNGIPVITVANDVPVRESLRRTYVGSDHYAAGEMLGRELVSDMGQEGTVVLIGSSQHQYDQVLRLNGIRHVLDEFPAITAVNIETLDAREQVMDGVRDILNRFPGADAFIAVNANIAETLIRELGKRTQIEPYHIYSFDDSPESLSLLQEGKLDGIIEQSPAEMGRLSVDLMVGWLNGEKVPLDLNGYFTDIRILKERREP